MDTYPCPACGGPADDVHGCRRCGRPHDPDAAALALFQRAVASLEAKKRSLTKEQLLTAKQLAHASAQRDTLRRRLRQRLTEQGGPSGGRRSLFGRRGRGNGTDGGTGSGPPSSPAAGPAGHLSQASPVSPGPEVPAASPTTPAARPAPPAAATPRPATPQADRPPTVTPQADRPLSAPTRHAPPVSGPSAAGPAPTGPPPSVTARVAVPGRGGFRPGAPPGRPTPPTTGSTITAERLRRAVVVPPQRTSRRPPRLRSTPARQVKGRIGGAEATTGSMQTALLGLGGLLLAGAAVVLTVIAFGPQDAGSRIGLLTLVTAVSLALPVFLARRGLTATAETVAAVALLLVLLDGYVAWSLGWFGAEVVPATVYFGLVCLATAGISIAYQATSHLVAPRYATLLVLQPVLPLLAYEWVRSPAGWALVLSAVALLDLGFGVALTTRAPITVTPLPSSYPPPPAPDPTPEKPTPEQPTPDQATPDQATADPATADQPTAIPAAPSTSTATAKTKPIVVDPLLVDPFLDEDALTARPDSGQLSQGVLRDVAWIAFAIAYGAAIAYAATALVSATTVAGTLRAAGALLVAAAVGVAGGFLWRRRPAPDFTAGVATLAFILSAARIGAVSLPGYTLLCAAGAVALTALVVPALPDFARRGPRLAATLAAAVTGLALLAVALPVIIAPLRAITPIWRADLSRYAGVVGEAAGPTGWQLFVAGLLLSLTAAVVVPRQVRADAVVIGLALTALVGPAGLGLGWLLTPAVTVLAAVAFGMVALTVPVPRTAWLCLSAAAVLGGYATLVSLARPSATALTLAAITIAGAVIAGAPRATRHDPGSELVVRRVTDAAGGGALFALPGAAAAGAALAVYGTPVGTPFVLAAGFLALAVALGIAALTQVARQEQSPPLVAGATGATAIVALATVLAPRTTLWDMAVALLMAISVALLWYAPSIEQRRAFGDQLSGPDVAAAAATVAGIAAVARAVTLVAPGSELITIAGLVLLTAIGTRALPRDWRAGPTTGGAVVGAGAALWAGGYALAGAFGVLRAANPIWSAPLGDAWRRTATQYADYGWEVPVALLFVAAAAAIALAPPRRDEVTAAAIGLAAMGAPVGLGLDWTAPMVLGWLAATLLGAAGAVTRSSRAAYTRVVVAAVVGLFAAGASLVRPAATAGVLSGLALSGALVAGLAAVMAMARRAERLEDRAHLTHVGGGATAGALLGLAGACAATAGAYGYAGEVVVSASLAACAVGLAIAALLCRTTPGYLPYVTGGVAAGATVSALATVPTDLPAAVYAAVAALVGVLAELVRVTTPSTEKTWIPAREFRPDRTDRPISAWRPVTRPGGFAFGVTLASGIAAMIAIVAVTPAVVAALVGPYRWVTQPWTGSASTGADLGPFQSWVGDGTDVLAAFILTLAAALATVGLGGDLDTVASRAVAVIIPGVAITMLIAPAALDAPWPVQPTAALLVATMAGLGLALTVPPPETAANAGLRDARRLVFVIAVLAAGAGGAGSLATEKETVSWFAGSVVVGLIAALRGRTSLARIMGWQVASGTAYALAVASALAADYTLAEASFPVLLVAALLLGLATVLPRWHPTESTVREIMTIELAAFGGGLLAVAATVGNPVYTAAALFAYGAVLGIAAARPGRTGQHRVYLIVAACLAELFAVWVLLFTVQVAVIEAYTLPFAVLALITGVFQLKYRPDLGSWVAYGPALLAGFLPTLVIVLATDASPNRRVLLIAAAVLTVAVGAVRRQRAPVVVGGVVTAVAMLHELVLLGRLLPWPVLLLLFTGAGVLLIALGATYERRRGNVRQRLRGAIGRMR